MPLPTRSVESERACGTDGLRGCRPCRAPTLLGAEEKPHDLNKVFKVASLPPLSVAPLAPSPGSGALPVLYSSTGEARNNVHRTMFHRLAGNYPHKSSPSLLRPLFIPRQKLINYTAPPRANSFFSPSQTDRIACVLNFQWGKARNTPKFVSD